MKRFFGVLIALAVMSTVVFAEGSQGRSSTGSRTGAPVKISVEIFDRGTDGGKTNPTDNQWTRWIKEKILKDENIDVSFVAVPRWTETEALVNLMAAGTPPDVCITYSADNITNWQSRGGLYDVSPYIDTTLKDLNAFLGPDPARRGKRLIERQRDNETNKIYALTSRRMNTAMRNIFIRKDWLDRLGLPLPKTTQEFYDALVAFRDRDPGNVGRNRVIPFTLMGDRVDWTAGNIIESFIDPNLSDRDRWVNLVAERNFLVPGYKEGLRFVNKMYNDGLIDRDFPLYKGEDNLTVLQSGVVGAFESTWDAIYREPNGILSNLQKNIPTANFVPVDCITSSDGLTHKPAYDVIGVFYFIPAASKNPDAAMRYLNWLAKYENYHFIQTGPEGIVHTLVDGIPKLNPTAGQGWIQNSAQNIDYTPMMNGLFLGSEDENIRAIANGYSWPADLVAEAYRLSMRNARPLPAISTKSPLTVAGQYAANLNNKGVTIYSQVITCSPQDFDRLYDAAIADWLATGAQAIINERIEKYIAP
ncbi:MAG: extracellular solute-binding protein [Treponema sp.]|jgi:putative aldouronate transport system substrate-binding protein|nr:extracellular solute-binding protein [Treponema sp.]